VSTLSLQFLRGGRWAWQTAVKNVQGSLDGEMESTTSGSPFDLEMFRRLLQTFKVEYLFQFFSQYA
jgi:hypothetical protein